MTSIAGCPTFSMRNPRVHAPKLKLALDFNGPFRNGPILFEYDARNGRSRDIRHGIRCWLTVRIAIPIWSVLVKRVYTFTTSLEVRVEKADLTTQRFCGTRPESGNHVPTLASK